MVRTGLRVWGVVCLVAVSVIGWRMPSNAVPLDKEGDLKFGARTYVNARIGTENTHDGAPITSVLHPGLTTSTSATWPHSAAGHLRQNRFFIEAELNHDLDRLVKEGVGPFGLLKDLPFKVKNLGYHLTFRGEGEMLYDWGPREYSTADQFNKLALLDPPNALVANQAQAFQDPARERRKVRQLGTDRERLYQAYIEANIGNLFLRVGRQILSWGETDGFRLLDNINPLDSSFGGFLISLDERRVPLDMLRAQYYLGGYGPFSEMYVEGYVAVDDKIGFIPGAPPGSPWGLPSNSAPSNDTRTINIGPARTFSDARGGVQLKFNLADATFGLAHYYTYFDTEALQVATAGVGYPTGPHNNNKTLLNAFDDGLPCPSLTDPTMPDSANPHCGAPTRVWHTAPRVQVSGLTTTFALPQFYSVIRSEIAYFKDQAAFTQGQLDPFLFNLSQPRSTRQQTGGRRLRDSVNFVLGIDQNQWIRFLNPNQTFFISTQFFYRHLKNAGDDKIYLPNGKLNPKREVLPLDLDVADFILGGTPVGRLEPIFITNPADSFLHTLFISTSYRSGTINPSLLIFYDWGGALVYQPAIQFSRDPFRFAIDYSILDSHIYKGGSGVSLLKDRDNIQFRFEYVI